MIRRRDSKNKKVDFELCPTLLWGIRRGIGPVTLIKESQV